VPPARGDVAPPRLFGRKMCGECCQPDGDPADPHRLPDMNQRVFLDRPPDRLRADPPRRGRRPSPRRAIGAGDTPAPRNVTRPQGVGPRSDSRLAHRMADDDRLTSGKVIASSAEDWVSHDGAAGRDGRFAAVSQKSWQLTAAALDWQRRTEPVAPWPRFHQLPGIGAAGPADQGSSPPPDRRGFSGVTAGGRAMPMSDGPGRGQPGPRSRAGRHLWLLEA
jgi:hypothetical protein